MPSRSQFKIWQILFALSLPQILGAACCSGCINSVIPPGYQMIPYPFRASASPEDNKQNLTLASITTPDLRLPATNCLLGTRAVDNSTATSTVPVSTSTTQTPSTTHASSMTQASSPTSSAGAGTTPASTTESTPTATGTSTPSNTNNTIAYEFNLNGSGYFTGTIAKVVNVSLNFGTSYGVIAFVQNPHIVSVLAPTINHADVNCDLNNPLLPQNSDQRYVTDLLMADTLTYQIVTNANFAAQASAATSSTSTGSGSGTKGTPASPPTSSAGAGTTPGSTTGPTQTPTGTPTAGTSTSPNTSPAGPTASPNNNTNVAGSCTPYSLPTVSSPQTPSGIGLGGALQAGGGKKYCIQYNQPVFFAARVVKSVSKPLVCALSTPTSPLWSTDNYTNFVPGTSSQYEFSCQRAADGTLTVMFWDIINNKSSPPPITSQTLAQMPVGAVPFGNQKYLVNVDNNPKSSSSVLIHFDLISAAAAPGSAPNS